MVMSVLPVTVTVAMVVATLVMIGRRDHVLARCIQWQSVVIRLVCLGQACTTSTQLEILVMQGHQESAVGAIQRPTGAKLDNRFGAITAIRLPMGSYRF